jgi:hypothetical protein
MMYRTKDLSKVTNYFAHVLVLLNPAFRSFIFYWQRKKIVKTFEYMEEISTDCKFINLPRNYYFDHDFRTVPFEEKFVRRFLRYTKVYAGTILSMGYIASGSYTLFLLYEVIVDDAKNYLFEVDFFFNINYQIINFMEVSMVVFLPCLHLSTILMYLSIGSILIEYLRMLQRSFKSAIDNKNFQQIDKLIQVHGKIIKLHESFNGFFMPITLTSYIFDVMMCCFSAYQIVEVRLLVYHEIQFS